MHELLVCQLVNETMFFKEQFRKDLKETFRNKMHKWHIWPCTQNNFQSECKVGLRLKEPENYKIQSLQNYRNN